MFSEIRLSGLLPNVFATSGLNTDKSDIWQKEISFSKGKRYLIEAESGTGKTSLCAYIMGMRKDYQGKIFFDTEDSSKLSSGKWSEIRRISLAWLPQEIGLFDNLSLEENLNIKNRLTKYLSENKISEYIERLGLSEKINTKAKFLSIGQQQRVGFVRMLCQPADFFLLDEPVSHLDAGNNKIMSDIMEEVLSLTGAGLIATSVGNRILIDKMEDLNL